MRFRRKKGDDEEVVSGDVVEEPTEHDPSAWALPADAAVTADDQQDDTVDMEAVAPATAAGGRVAREQEEADEGAEAARLADEERARAEAAHAEAEAAEKEAREREEQAQKEAEAAAERQREEAAEAREAAEEAAEADDTGARAIPHSSVSGASVMSPGLGADASPRAAAAANDDPGPASAASARVEPQPAAVAEPAAPPSSGPLAPVLDHPAVQKKPELLMVGGLAAGFAVAKLLKALTSGDE